MVVVAVPQLTRQREESTTGDDEDKAARLLSCYGWPDSGEATVRVKWFRK